MSTNSLVAYMNEDWKVTTSYVHYDGYATGVGEALLENYNTEELAKDLCVNLGYASSLKESVKASHSDRANVDEPVVYENFLEFEEYIRKNSGLEYVYVWVEPEGKWQVASWTRTKKKFFTGEGLDYEFSEDWTGFEDLVPVFVREGVGTVKRMRKLAEEGSESDYANYADELELLVDKWREIGISGVARNFVSEMKAEASA